MLICIECEKPRKLGTRRCRECQLKRKRELAKLRYAQKGKTLYPLYCEACNIRFHSYRKNSRLCLGCYNKSQQVKKCTNNYEYNSANYTNYLLRHKEVAEKVLERSLKKREVVHHVDGNPKNNAISNLWVISRELHGKLHAYLRVERVIHTTKNPDKSWDNKILEVSNNWIRGKNIIKLEDI